MTFRLYESAWVLVEGTDGPVQVHKDPSNTGAFLIGGNRYDIDARPWSGGNVPLIASILSIQDVREAGLRSNYTDGR